MLPFHSPLETTATESEFVDSAMIVGVAVLVERFYKPELDAAHNPPLQAIGQASSYRSSLFTGVMIPSPGITDNWDCLT
jgi:hypothetical protein